MPVKPIRIGLVGAGYIASWHADAIRATAGTELACICDISPAAAQGLAEAYGVPAYTSVAEMVAAGLCDAAHILTQPHLHHDLAVECLAAGLHCFVEKPFATSRAEADAMVAAADKAGRHLGVGHNFLGLPGYERLKRAFQAGDLGRVSSAEINWHFPLTPLRSGPFGLWLLRAPGNLLLELGPHPFAFAQDLFGTPDILHLDLGKPIDLPGGGTRPQSWRILARAGGVDLTFNLSMVEVVDDRSVTLRGSSGMARLDYGADTLITQRDNAADLVLNPFLKQMSLAGQHLREGGVNAVRQLTSLNAKSPYGLSFRNAVGSFYRGIRDATPDPRFTGENAAQIIGSIEAALDLMPAGDPPPRKRRRKPKPSVLVIGGTGFIGQHLTRALVAQGKDVRVLSRGSTGPFADIAGHVEMAAVSLTDEPALRAAMTGIDTVYNLAKSLDKTWQACLENDVGVSDRIAGAALAEKVRRFVYTGTIASFDMSRPDSTITDATGFAADMTDRNLYARSKAECERRLSQMHRDDGLPLVIARPGIVLGQHGPLQHWGIGRWHGAGAVRVWGNGRNILPFVLIDDVVDGLIRMAEADAAVGHAFNLVGDPMWSARDYFDAIHKAFGARIRVVPGWLTGFYLADSVKSVLKSRLLRRKGVIRPSLRDWKSRAHLSRFDNSHAKQALDWTPESDRAGFARRAVAEVDLFGF